MHPVPTAPQNLPTRDIMLTIPSTGLIPLNQVISTVKSKYPFDVESIRTLSYSSNLSVISELQAMQEVFA